MRVIAVCAIALLLTGCTWVRKELAAPPLSFPPARSAPESKPHKPNPGRPPQVQSSAPVTAPAADYSARCRDMAANRGVDARQLGASAADQAKVQADTYRDCMAQSKPAQ
ncbi:MAG: hypothetical protein JO294_12450 [Alphaproteobacteria bacterium]|nr:hypothetical protein [Alphaproteobacteria bacterium]